MTGTPAGWYHDAQGTSRWFDGTAWTEHTQPADNPTDASEQPTQWTPAYVAPAPVTAPATGSATGPASPGSARGGSRGILVVLGIISGLLVAGIVVVAVLLAT